MRAKSKKVVTSVESAASTSTKPIKPEELPASKKPDMFKKNTKLNVKKRH